MKLDECKCRELYNQGKLDSEIANELGCYHLTIWSWRKRNKLPKNSRKQLHLNNDPLHVKMLELYNRGMADKEIAKELGIKYYATVCRWRKANNLKYNTHTVLPQVARENRAKPNNKDSLCWFCQRATANPDLPCKWAQDLRPDFKNWIKYKPTILKQTQGDGKGKQVVLITKSYQVIKCRKFIQDDSRTEKNNEFWKKNLEMLMKKL